MSSSNQFNHLDKHHIRHSFNHAANSYDEVAVLQQEVAQRLIQRLDVVRLQPERIIDIGSGTGFCSQILSQRYPKSDLLNLDSAQNMLRTARQKRDWKERCWKRQHAYICGDAEQLPIADSSVQLITSSLALQWCFDLDKTFADFRRILQPNGLLMFATFGPDTLKELKQSWQAVDQQTHVHSFIDMHDVGDALMRAGFADPVMDMEYFTLTYDDVFQLMRELKMIGANNASTQRHKGLTSKTNLQKMQSHYETLRDQGKLPATYEVVYGHAWVGEQTGSEQNSSPNQVNVNFSTPGKS